VTSHSPDRRNPAGGGPWNDPALRKVEASLTWYSEHMAEQPKLEQVAQAIYDGVSRLRRLFCRVFKDYHKISPNAWRRTRLSPYRETDSTRR
jgi:AraC-like DNA-binding protein